jgi:hypothetical protein
MRMETAKPQSRLATLDELIQNTIPVFISPTPTRETLRAWFDSAQIPRFKTNPTAKRGGGPCYYSVPHVEKLLRSRTMPKRVLSCPP